MGNLGSDAATTVFSTSDGDNLVETSDQWIGTDDADGSGRQRSFTTFTARVVFSPNVEVIGDNIFWEYEITVPAGETVRLAHFTITGATRAAAIASANGLVTSAGFGGEAAAFLTQGELASLANFQFNEPPSIAADAGAVSAPEGSDATNTGTFSDAQGNSTVTITASSGTVTKDDSAGTWSWSLNTADGPAGPFTVTITATDDQGAAVQTTFTYSVNNVAPQNRVNAGVDQNPVNEGDTMKITVNLTGSFSDPASADTHTQDGTWSGRSKWPATDRPLRAAAVARSPSCRTTTAPTP